MKKYDFETVIPRYGVGSGKWEEMRKVNPDIDDDVIPFSVADMELKNPPEIIEGLQKYLDDHILGYTMPTQEYLNSVCNWMKKRHNWDIKPEWLCYTNGVVEAFFAAINAFTKTGEGVMLMTPVYYPMYFGIEYNDRVLVENKLIRTENTYEIDFEDFENKAKDENTKILLLCSPHNPTGRVWTREELTKIGRICIDNNVLIVSDEIHFDLILPGYTHTVFASISEEFSQHSVICTAPSKTFNLAGMQTSNIIIPNEDIRKIFEIKLKSTKGNPKCPQLGYEACRLAYENCEKWLDMLIELIDTNRKTVIDFMSKELPQVKVMSLEGTYLLWMDMNALGIECHELERIMRMEAQMFFDEGYIFGAAGEGFERWNLACPAKYIEEGLIRMKKALKPYLDKTKS